MMLTVESGRLTDERGTYQLEQTPIVAVEKNTVQGCKNATFADMRAILPTPALPVKLKMS
jgi:hypothetical protein